MMATRADRVSEYAERLRLAEQRGVPTPLIFGNGGQDLALAYAIQRANVCHGIAQGRQLVGRKIGLTDRAVQLRFGLVAPICGALFADMAVANGGTAAVARVMGAQVEPEIGVVLERDLTTAGPTSEHVLDAIAHAMPALEIIGSRFSPGEATVADDVADNGGSGLYVYGDALQGPLTSHRFMTMTVERDGNPSPQIASARIDWDKILAATAWLAAALVDEEAPLRAGDIVLTGAVMPETAARAGDRITATIDDHAMVSVSFTGAAP